LKKAELFLITQAFGASGCAVAFSNQGLEVGDGREVPLDQGAVVEVEVLKARQQRLAPRVLAAQRREGAPEALVPTEAQESELKKTGKQASQQRTRKA
jgi:hypothetical protein